MARGISVDIVWHALALCGMERSEISLHEVKVYQALKNHPDKWMTNHDIAELVGISERTVRLHSRRFVTLGLLDLAEVFPAHRFRWSSKDSRRNKSYVLRIEHAVEAFGLDGNGNKQA